LLAFAAVANPVKALAAPSGKVLYQFRGGLQGDTPFGALIQDSSGALYGTTSGTESTLPRARGTVFMLTPPTSANGHWTQTVLYAFRGGRDGGYPESNLVVDAAGNLFGTVRSGGIFELKAPAAPGGTWTESLIVGLYQPSGSLLRRGDGVLYGVADGIDLSGGNSGYGVAYEVIPPRAGTSKWEKRAIYTFRGFTDGSGPLGGLASGPNGSLYGTTLGGGSGSAGTVFKLTPPASISEPWIKTTLYSFQDGATDGGEPEGALLLDSSGNIFGTTKTGGPSGFGIVFKLEPPSTGSSSWTERLIYIFQQNVGVYPYDGLIFGPDHSLYGTTLGYPLVFRLAPPVGTDANWRFKQVWYFNQPNGPAGFMGSLLRAHDGNLYGLAISGGLQRCQNNRGCGAVYEVTP
jgi:uncharacterized repeat protein (TIGR03803 family)